MRSSRPETIVACIASALILLPLLSILSVQVAAIPPLPMEFHGIVVISNAYAPIDTTIEVLTEKGIVCGRFILSEPGFYGYLSCKGDDPSTSAIEGPTPGEKVVFAIDGEVVNTSTMPWKSGSFKEVHLLTGSPDGLSLIQEPARTSYDVSTYLESLLGFAVAFAVLTGIMAWMVTSRWEKRRW